MGIADRDFEEIDESDIAQLIDAGASEGVRLDFKQQPYGDREADRKEFLKDVSAFANTAGGDLIIGLEEQDLVATAVLPISAEDAAKEAERLENLARDGLEPRIQMRIRAVPVANGYVIVCRVAPSWYPPHRVKAYHSNRIYVRGSTGAVEASMDELRRLFLTPVNAREKVEKFVSMRLRLIGASELGVPLAGESDRLVVHVLSLNSLSDGSNVIDIQRAQAAGGYLAPIKATHYTSRINLDGFISFRGQDACYGYKQLFRHGAIEETRVNILSEQRSGDRILRISEVEADVINSVLNSIEALRYLQVAPPLVIVATLQNVRGAIPVTNANAVVPDLRPPVYANDISLPYAVIEEYGAADSYDPMLRPLCDVLWNAAAEPASRSFGPDGRLRSRDLKRS